MCQKQSAKSEHSKKLNKKVKKLSSARFYIAHKFCHLFELSRGKPAATGWRSRDFISRLGFEICFELSRGKPAATRRRSRDFISRLGFKFVLGCRGGNPLLQAGLFRIFAIHHLFWPFIFYLFFLPK